TKISRHVLKFNTTYVCCSLLSSDTTPLLNGSSQDRMFEAMAVEIEQLLGKLTAVNDKMAEYTNSAGVPSLNAALMHTLQRHRDILQVRQSP
ncbi:Golgi SNAP receptor complex member 1, partial [Notechis scutatus]|uniref:Golgi SNAP receptor complex member 1 n=1 Tax=Notechis scutatus TaxID=8663 RepID=A0A6J1VSD5_9SAUR